MSCLTGEHVVYIFLDLEKAYDTTWKYGIMKDLHEPQGTFAPFY